MTASPTASELNQGKELTEERVRELRAIYVGTDHDIARDVVRLCDAWLSSRSSEAPSRRGEGDEKVRWRASLPVRVESYWVTPFEGYFEIIDADGEKLATCSHAGKAGAIAYALNKNTGGGA